MNVAVLGCGPAGLMAAHAVKERGHNLQIFSNLQKSQISGAQYLHEGVEGITDAEPDGQVHYVKHGTRAGYAEKVYGRADAPCSWDQFEVGPRPAWRLEDVYDRLWDLYFDHIFDYLVEPSDIPLLLDDNDLVISAIPKPSLCIRQHKFEHKSIWIADYSSLKLTDAENVVLYNGDPLDHWYRSSRLWGHEATESATPMEGAKSGIKPLSNTCDCWESDGVKFVGRFGKWEKGILVHHAYESTVEALGALQQV